MHFEAQIELMGGAHRIGPLRLPRRGAFLSALGAKKRRAEIFRQAVQHGLARHDRKTLHRVHMRRQGEDQGQPQGIGLDPQLGVQ